jgi:separase
LEAIKVLGKDSQELQLENGILALVGKLVALGLDSLAVKEMRHLKRRLDAYLEHSKEPQHQASRSAEKDSARSAPGEKESLASLLDFAALEPASPALPIIASLQTYALRVIARLNRPRIVEAAYEHLKLSNPSSPANLIQHLATTSNNPAKSARQLESLTQTILALCPNISNSHDDKPLQAAPETVLLLQHLAFKVRKVWWALAKHQGNDEQEILDPFTKCLVAFARRSQLPPKKKYTMVHSLYTDLIGSQHCPNATGGSNTVANNTLSSLAQAAGLSEEALRWLGTAKSTSPSATSQAKQAARLVRIANVSIEASVKGDIKPDLQEIVTSALEGLGGSLGGSSVDLDALFLEVNGLRRAVTRLLVSRSSTPDDNTEMSSVRGLAVDIIVSSVHFTARMVGSSHPNSSDTKAQQRHSERMNMVWKCAKSVIDSVLVCCKEVLVAEDQWKKLDLMLQECSLILHRFEEAIASGTQLDTQDKEIIQALSVKISNAYWAVHLQLRKAKCSSETIVTAMQRSINLIRSGAQTVREAGHLTMKLENLGDILESLDMMEKSRKAFGQCINAHLESSACQVLSGMAAKHSLQTMFHHEGPLSTLARVVKSYHRGFIKTRISNSEKLAFFDDPELQPDVRGALLELQLGLYIRTLSKNRQWDSSLDASIRSLVERLQDLYAPTVYPMRYLRLLVLLLQLRQSHANVLPKDDLTPDIPAAMVITASGSEDAGLARYEEHLKAICALKSSMHKTLPPKSTLKECFSTWESLVDKAKSWESLLDHVDDAGYLVAELKASVEFLNAKGEEYLALPVLHLLVKVSELEKNADASELVDALCALGLQFLRLGYTGKAGLSLARAESLVTKQTTSTEAKLRWHVAYAEYLARIGNTAKW